MFFFFFNDTATTEIYTLSLHDALPISSLNTAISALMVFVNEAMTWEMKPCSVMRDFLILLHPFAPHVAEELWARLHAAFPIQSSSLAYAPWPKFNPELLIEAML